MHGWNLSYSSLTGVAAWAHLRELKTSNPIFWEELTSTNLEQDLPGGDILQQEDERANLTATDNVNDSDVPITVVIESLIHGSSPAGYKVSGDGGFEAVTAAETFDDDELPDNNGNGEVELGCGKHQQKSNRLYDMKQFWRHYNDENSSEEGVCAYL